MKKYIVPIARNINIEAESIIALSSADVEGNGLDLSNRRNYSVSEDIWSDNAE